MILNICTFREFGKTSTSHKKKKKEKKKLSSLFFFWFAILPATFLSFLFYSNKI